jgi:hypothetical protein
MKKLFFTIWILLDILLESVSGQYMTPYTIGSGGDTKTFPGSYFMGQPFAGPGDQTVGLGHFLWFPADTTFRYNIGDIPDKSIFHNSTCRFRIFWEEHPEAGFSYRLIDQFDTSVVFEQEEGTAVFEYSPMDTDYSTFAVEFTAIDSEDTTRQIVNITPVPVMKPEFKLLRYQHDPTTFDTLLIVKTWHRADEPMNFTGNDSVVRIDLIGKTIVFRNGDEPFLYNNISNLEELNIYAVDVIICDRVFLPQTKVNIWCENLIFEDSDSVRACFITTPREPTTYELTGLNASPFHCYARQLTAPGNHLRFFLNGGKGSPSMMQDIYWTAPGGGGNAGDFYTNLNIKALVCQDGGPYGEPHEWDPLPAGPRGQAGIFHFNNNRYTWLHPHAVRLMLQYARENYICGQEEETYRMCNKYTGLIRLYRETEEWENDSLNNLDLQQLEYSFSSIRDQLDDRLDYYGNPWNWAPLLSFEANLENYENEMEYAIRVLYLNYWMTNKAADLASKQEAAELLKNENLEEIMRLKEKYQEAYVDYSPSLMDFKKYSTKLDSLTVMYNQKIESLLIVAKRNVATSLENILRQVGNIAGQVCKLIPHPAAQAIGTGLSVASSLDYEDPLSMDNLNVVFDNLSESLDGFEGVADAASGFIGGLSPEGMAEPEQKQAKENAKSLVNNMAPDDPLNVGVAIKELTFPNDMVKKEFEKLKSECPVLKVWTDSMDVYSQKKGQAAEKVTFIRYQLTSIPREISKLLLACDAMDDILLSTDNIVDPRAMTYLNEMKNSAWERMLRYHYYMALAYQYRFLKPYEQPLNIRPLFESFDTLAKQDADLSPDQYNALLPVFQDQIKQISDEIYTTFNNGTYNERNTRISFTLDKDQLETLNRYGELRINIWNSGKIPLDHVDCRITEISIDETSLAISSDTILKDASLTITMAHSGNSLLIHPISGKHIGFTQYNKDAMEYYNANKMSPLGWAEKYFFDDGEMITIERSLASQSLIRHILDQESDDDLLIFTRPAANAEVKILSELYTGEQTNMNYRIDSLTLSVRIDYQEASGFSNILVNSSRGMMPLIRCSTPDITGKGYGWGNFTRSYSQSTGLVTFIAPETYGIYAFDKWLKTTNSITESISNESVTVNTLYHHWITAVYKLNVPRLDLPDTVYADWNQGILDITVKNSNRVDHLPMTWFSLLDEAWVTIDEGTETGMEEGTIRLIISDNNDNQRTAKMMVYAMDAVNPEKEITIIQKEHFVGINVLKDKDQLLRIYPNPAGQEISIELPGGFYQEKFTINIYTFDGKRVYQQLYPGGSPRILKIPIEGFFPGMYLVKAVQGENICISKFSKY